MTGSDNSLRPGTLGSAVQLSGAKLLNPSALTASGGISSKLPVLVILAAGKGTRFGLQPKCIQPVRGTPLARHSIDAYRRFCPSPVICLVGYRHEEVSSALGGDNIFVRSDNPAGGTAFAAFEAFCVPELLQKNPLVVITMGDRIVPCSIFNKLWDAHAAGAREADLTLLTAIYEPPKNKGKGRILRDDGGRVIDIVEERDIRAEKDETTRQAMANLTEGNCPLYIARAATLHRCLRDLTNDNAQGQYYLTDIVRRISREGGDVRTITTRASDPEYDLLCSDVTQPMDLALLEGIAARMDQSPPGEAEVKQAADAIAAGRPAGQVASIVRQLEDLLAASSRENLGFSPEEPVGLGVSGGRLRIAFMHPDMMRFFGPAWQMPIGGADAAGQEQIVMLVQSADDRRIHLYPLDPQYREKVNSIASDDEVMFPPEQISDLHAYEEFGTRMSESLLLSLGYFSDDEIRARKDRGLPVPPPSLWISSNMRRPFTLVGNAIASLRTLRQGNIGAKVQRHLGKERFRGLRLICTGNIPQGGFSSSSAVTVATKNAISSLLDLGIGSDLLVHLACQAEYGTGVRAGSLDQATEQKGQAGKGTLISSNPRDNYHILGSYAVPTDRFAIIFPYSVQRDRAAWQWSWGFYGSGDGKGPLTAGQIRKITGKAAEIAAIITRLPLSTDFFKEIEADLLEDGLLSLASRQWICSVLQQLPLLARREELRRLVQDARDWYALQLGEPGAAAKADTVFESLLAGWDEPHLRRAVGGEVVIDQGVPLRSMVAYLFAEVAKNFYLIHHPDEWIRCITLSQRGDCCVDIDPAALPTREQMESQLPWEAGLDGPELMNAWLDRHGARPFDCNRGLDDASLSQNDPPRFHMMEGGNFFRGLALIDLVEAMLKRAFGDDAVAVRVNAAGQGDYFQVHIDKTKADPNDVKNFLRLAFYRRFKLAPDPEFVQLHPGGPAIGVKLSRFDLLPKLIRQIASREELRL